MQQYVTNLEHQCNGCGSSYPIRGKFRDHVVNLCLTVWPKCKTTISCMLIESEFDLCESKRSRPRFKSHDNMQIFV